MPTPKQQLTRLLARLPADCSVEDIQYHLYVLQTIRHRLALVHQGRVVPHSEAEKRMAKWIRKEGG